MTTNLNETMNNPKQIIVNAVMEAIKSDTVIDVLCNVILEKLEQAGIDPSVLVENMAVLNFAQYKSAPLNGCEFRHYSNEMGFGGKLEPPQVHVRTTDGNAKFWLNFNGTNQVQLDKNNGIRNINFIEKHIIEIHF